MDVGLPSKMEGMSFKIDSILLEDEHRKIELVKIARDEELANNPKAFS